MGRTLKVSEIYLSIQGESTRAGLPCVLVRLAGCNLRCSWCDTPHARDEAGRDMTPDEILRKVGSLSCRRVEVTGGEPLAQPATGELLGLLCDAGYETLLETNGSLDIAGLDPRVRRIVDIKCPSSGQADSNLWENLAHVGERDEVKFVIAGEADYRFAARAVAEHSLAGRCEVIFSPGWGKLDPATLAEWILADGMDVRLGLQLHKIIWPGRDRGV